MTTTTEREVYAANKRAAEAEQAYQGARLCDERHLQEAAVEIRRLRAALAGMVTLAREATNGWACFATRKAEHDDIARLHHEIDTLTVTVDVTHALALENRRLRAALEAARTYTTSRDVPIRTVIDAALAGTPEARSPLPDPPESA